MTDSDTHPDSELSGAEWIARAATLAPILAERSVAAQETLVVAKETVADMKAAGIYNFLKPERFGGVDVSYSTFLSVTEELAVGCSSASWVFSVMTETNWILGSFAEEAQQEIWGEDPSALGCAVIVARGGPARKVDGGYLLSGEWAFCSGSDHAQWVVLGTMLEDGSGPFYMLLPMTDVEIVRDWFVLGMRGTGSNSISIEDAFIPEHRVVEAQLLLDTESPGRYCDPQFRLGRAPRMALAPYTLSANPLGIARRTLGEVGEILRTRQAAGREPSPMAMMSLAEAAAKISMARKSIHLDVERVEKALEDGTIDQISRPALLRDLSYASQNLRQATEQLADIIGADWVYDRHPLQAAIRDAMVASRHKSGNWDLASAAFSRDFLSR